MVKTNVPGEPHRSIGASLRLAPALKLINFVFFFKNFVCSHFYRYKGTYKQIGPKPHCSS